MAKAARKTTMVPANPAPVPFLDPALLPDEYALRIRGDCMEPILLDGSAVLVDRRLPYKSGDLVAIYLRPETVQPGHGNVILKRMISLPPWVKAFPYRDSPASTALAALLVEMLNPQRFFGIRCADILAIHHCVGPVPANVTLTPAVGPRLASVHASDIMKAKPTRRAILAGCAAIPALTVPAMADPAADAELIALGRQLDPIIAEWQTQYAIDIAERAVFEAKVEQATGIDLQNARRMDDGDLDDPTNYWAIRGELAKSDDNTPDDQSPWDDIHGRMFPLIEAILALTPKTLAGLIVQARAITLSEVPLWTDEYRADDRPRQFFEAVCAFVGVVPVALTLEDAS